MRRKLKPLVQFNAFYYEYPTSVSRGYWGKYPIENGLSDVDKKRRQKWIAEVNKRSCSEFHIMVSETFISSSDLDLMRSLLRKHGLYVERFFHKVLHERVARIYPKIQFDLQEFQRLLSLAWVYNHEISNKTEVIYHIVEHIYEQVLIQAINIADIHQELILWFDDFSRYRTCALCGDEFRVIDLPDWIYFGSNGAECCCFQCKIIESPKKSELTRLLPAFVDVCGFIPYSDASPITYSFTSRISNGHYVDVFLAYARMGGIVHVKKKFGSWFKGLAETNALPEGVLVTARGIRCLAKDGHECHSLDEQRIDNWLFSHSIPHSREPNYPEHPELNPTGRRRADWKVHDTLIEYFGLIGDSSYEKKMVEKIQLASVFKIKLIAIYPSDIGNLECRLRGLKNL